MKPVESMYDAFAEHYDDFTADHRYDDLTTTLEGLAREHGLSGRRRSEPFEQRAESRLAPDGVYVFDVNTLGAYRTTFAQTACVEHGGRFFAWRGQTDRAAEPGVRAVAAIEIFRDEGNGSWSHHSSRHVQRHHSCDVVQAAAAAAGLSILAARGLTPDGTLHPRADELNHAKRVYVARRAG